MNAWWKENFDKVLNRVVGLCFLIFLLGVIIPIIGLSFDRENPIEISNMHVCPGVPGKLTCITADLSIKDDRHCGATVSPIFIGQDGEMAIATQTMHISPATVHQMQIASPGKFKSTIMMPRNIKPGTAQLSVELDIACEDNFTQRIVPISKNVLFAVEVLDEVSGKRK